MIKAKINHRRELLRLQRVYEETTKKHIRKAVKLITDQIPLQLLTPKNYSRVIRQSTYKAPHFTNAFITFYRIIGQAAGGDMLDRIDGAKAHPFFSIRYAAQLVTWLLENRLGPGNMIKIMNKNLADHIITLIAELIEGAQDNEEENFDTIVNKLAPAFEEKGFYKWQIDRIVRTESTIAANRARYEAAKQRGGRYVKQWISIHDKRTRREPFDHLDMDDGQTIPYLQPFAVPMEGTNETDYLQYPGDPKGEASNIINCRCTFIILPWGMAGIGERPKPELTDLDNLPAPKMGTMAEFEDEIRGNKYETGAVFDLNGKMIFRKVGTESQVTFSNENLKWFKGNTLTHNHPAFKNHPQHGGGSFSKADIVTSFVHRLKTIRAVDKVYAHEWTWDWEAIDEAYKDARNGHLRAYPLLKAGFQRAHRKNLDYWRLLVKFAVSKDEAMDLYHRDWSHSRMIDFLKTKYGKFGTYKRVKL